MVQQAPMPNSGVDSRKVSEMEIEMTGYECDLDTIWCNKRQYPTVV